MPSPKLEPCLRGAYVFEAPSPAFAPQSLPCLQERRVAVLDLPLFDDLGVNDAGLHTCVAIKEVWLCTASLLSSAADLGGKPHTCLVFSARSSPTTSRHVHECGGNVFMFCQCVLIQTRFCTLCRWPEAWTAPAMAAATASRSRPLA